MSQTALKSIDASENARERCAKMPVNFTASTATRDLSESIRGFLSYIFNQNII